MTILNKKYPRGQIAEELWRRGVLAPWKLHETQLLMYKTFHEVKTKKFVINSSRRLGKTFMLCVIAIEYAINNPNAQIKFVAPSQKMVRKIITPIFKYILADCPKDMRPKYNTTDGEYNFPNDACISIAGTEMGQIDNLRGQACDLALVDEAGFCQDLKNVLDDVIMPQTLGRKHARLIIASTPPKSPDHYFVELAAEAMANKAYAKYTIYDNPRLSKETIEEYKKEAGGEDSTTWRREYLAEFVTDTEMAIFPEARDEVMNDIVYDHPRPQFFTPFTAIDLGYVDNTGILFGYYDFAAGKIVIEDEILLNKTTSGDIVKICKSKEEELWGKDREVKHRVVDGNAMQIADFNSMHRFKCYGPEKTDLIANVNRVRIDINDRRMFIHPRCSNLIAQVKHATWDKSKTKFSRSSDAGHWDLVAALIYFIKHIDRVTNPIPPGLGYNVYDHFGYPRKHKTTHLEAFKNMFPALRRDNK